MAQIKTVAKRILKIGLWLFALSITGCMILICSFLLWSPIRSYVNQTTFDTVQWKAALDRNDPVKQRMLSSLTTNHRLIGKTKNEIDQLLGKPPTTGYFKEYDYVYWLGPERSLFGIDSEWLCLKFENDKVVAVKVLTD